jgi:signal peptidase II
MNGSIAWWLYDWAGLNQAVLLYLQSSSAAVGVAAWAVSALASYWSAPVVVAALAWRAESSIRPDRAALLAHQLKHFLLAGMFAVGATWLIKGLFSLPRPFEVMELAAPAIARASSTASLPSGHSVYAALLVATLWPLARTAGRVGLVFLAAAVGWSRVAQGIHFPADVLWGWILGLGCACIAGLAMSAAPARRLSEWASACVRLTAERLAAFGPWSQDVLPTRGSPAEAQSHLRFAWWALAFGIAGMDLLIKSAVHDGLPYGVSIPVTAFFNVVHHWNLGAAFGVLADADGWQRYFLVGVAAIVSVVLLGTLLTPLRPMEALSFALFTGGALGNGIERVLRGYVVDYLDFHWSGVQWPAFNLADVSLSVAVVVMALAWYGTSSSSRPRGACR